MLTPKESVNPRIDVLGLGAVAIDELLYVDGYPAADGKTRVRRRERQGGGQTGTALVAAARFGVRAAYAGLLGPDPLSAEVVENFRREGIATGWAVISAGARPAYSTIIVDRVAKTRTIFSSVEGELGADPDQPGVEVLCSARVLLIDHHGVAGSLRAARIARQAGRAVVADFERDPGPPFATLLETVDHLIVSSRFAGELTGLADAKDALRALSTAGRQLTAVTCGANGCFYSVGSNPGCVYHQPAFEIEVADTTGCGDVFHGVYAAVLAENAAPEDRVRTAAAAAALKAAHCGGQAGIPDRASVERFLARH